MFEKIVELVGFTISSTEMDITDEDGSVCLHTHIYRKNGVQILQFY